jgi:hypothetical protein
MKLEFIDSDDEISTSIAAVVAAPEYRPGRMGLGYTLEMHKDKIRKENEKQKLERKLLGLKRQTVGSDPDDDLGVSHQSSSEDEDRSRQFQKKTVPQQPVFSISQTLSKGQKKRLRLKNRCSAYCPAKRHDGKDEHEKSIVLVSVNRGNAPQA